VISSSDNSVIDDTNSSATSLDISDVGFSGFVISSFGGFVLVVGNSVVSVIVFGIVVVSGNVVNGVGKKGLKEVVGAREVCGGSTVVTEGFVVGVVEGATVSTTVVVVVAGGNVVVVSGSVVVVGTSVTGTVVVGAIVVLVVVDVVDVVVSGHVVVVSGVVVVVSGIVVVVGSLCIPLYDNSY
jgi:hypothetical protein